MSNFSTSYEVNQPCLYFTIGVFASFELTDAKYSWEIADGPSRV